MRTTSPGHRLVFPAIIAAAMMSGMACDRNDPHGPDAGAAVLLLEGTVASDVGGSVAGAAVLLEATGTNSGVVVAAAVTDSGGRYSIDVEIPDGCSAAGVSVTVEATRHHHRHAVVAAPQVACGARQTLDVIMVREGFPTPQPVQGGLVAEQISAGISPTCATTTTGAWCWGPPIVLAGPHDGSHAAVPEPVFGGTRFTHVEGGMNHVCALDDGGSAWCWGRDSGGRLGVAGVDASSQPVRVESDLRFVELAAGRWSTCGRTDDGRVYCWGQNRAVGNEEAGGRVGITSSPVRIASERRFTQISAHFAHTCALDDGGEVLCWGWAYRGEMGEAVPEGDAFDPVLVPATESFTAIAAGNTFTCAVSAAGAAYCWGTGWDGRLGAGDGAPADTPTPIAVAGGYHFAGIAAGGRSACAWTAGGAAFCWGSNEHGQLGADPADHGSCGTPAAPCSSEPIPVATGLRFSQIDVGEAHACGITRDSEIYCWGSRSALGAGFAVDSAQAPD